MVVIKWLIQKISEMRLKKSADKLPKSATKNVEEKSNLWKIFQFKKFERSYIVENVEK